MRNGRRGRDAKNSLNDTLWNNRELYQNRSGTGAGSYLEKPRAQPRLRHHRSKKAVTYFCNRAGVCSVDETKLGSQIGGCNKVGLFKLVTNWRRKRNHYFWIKEFYMIQRWFVRICLNLYERLFSKRRKLFLSILNHWSNSWKNWLRFNRVHMSEYRLVR